MSKSSLHIVSKGPTDSSLMQHCLDAFMPGDALLLIENAVYWAMPNYGSQLEGVKIFYLLADAEARGLGTPTELLGSSVDDDGFVDLCVEHSKSVSWN